MARKKVKVMNEENEIKVALPQEFQLKLKKPMKKADWEEVQSQLKSILFGIGDFEMTFKKELSIVDTYFDDKQLDFYNNIGSCRLRQVGINSKINIKVLDNKESGVYKRKEFEFDTTINELDRLRSDHVLPRKIESTAALNYCQGKLFYEILKICNQRVSYGMKKGSVEYELCIDRYYYTYPQAWFNGTSKDFYEIEIEALNEAAKLDISNFGKQLTESLKVPFSDKPKYQHGVEYFKAQKQNRFLLLWDKMATSSRIMLIFALISILVGVVGWLYPRNVNQ